MFLLQPQIQSFLICLTSDHMSFSFFYSIHPPNKYLLRTYYMLVLDGKSLEDTKCVYESLCRVIPIRAPHSINKYFLMGFVWVCMLMDIKTKTVLLHKW